MQSSSTLDTSDVIGLFHSTFSHTHKVANNGINANFVFATWLQFSSLFVSKYASKYEIRCHLVKGITFQGCQLYWSF